MAQALETSIPEFELTGRVQRRLGDAPREAGSGVYRCRDGFVSMVAGRLGTAQAWTRLREWLVEDGAPGAEELWEASWDDLEFRRGAEAIERFARIFGAFAARYGKQELYIEAQRRSIALSPVNDLAEVLNDEQLAARGFFVEAVDEVDWCAGARSDPAVPPFAARPGALRGRSDRRRGRDRRAPAAMSLERTLSDLRVIDFCWVGAGALVTKLLAEHGADVIKIESRERPDNLRVAPPFRPGREGLDGSGYFASRNNDKRSFALNMRHPKSRSSRAVSWPGCRRGHEQLPARRDGALGPRLRGAVRAQPVG